MVVGIILLLFTVGLEFSFSNLKRIKNYVFGAVWGKSL